MTVSTTAPIAHGLVQVLRYGHGPRSYRFTEGDSEGELALTGNWLYDTFAPEKADYPFVTYQQIYGPPFYLWGSVLFRAGYDVKVFSDNSVDAENIDALIATLLNQEEIPVAEQSTLMCRRMADLRSPDVDEQGRKIYMFGGTYEVWTDAPLPQTIRAGFTLDAVIV